jgi:KDZ transposase-like protein
MKSTKACDRTGIVAVACARHGCFAPNCIVDMYLGEQQKIVDFCLLRAFITTHVHPSQRAMFMYDIMCQYFVHLWDRIGHLLPAGLEIDRAIGMFHVHGHKEECFYRYAPSFIPESANVSGEILESLWANMNTITPAMRTASLAHRAELIDDHALDSNHKKLLGMGKSLLHNQAYFTIYFSDGVGKTISPKH